MTVARRSLPHWWANVRAPMNASDCWWMDESIYIYISFSFGCNQQRIFPQSICLLDCQFGGCIFYVAPACFEEKPQNHRHRANRRARSHTTPRTQFCWLFSPLFFKEKHIYICECGVYLDLCLPVPELTFFLLSERISNGLAAGNAQWLMCICYGLRCSVCFSQSPGATTR